MNPVTYMPHGWCVVWDDALLAIMTMGDALTAASYFGIPAVLLFLIGLRKDLAYKPGFLLSAAFIAFCGGGHIWYIITIWYPFYWASAVWTLCTGLVSVVTLIYLIPVLRRVRDLPSQEDLERLRRMAKAEDRITKAFWSELDHTLGRIERLVSVRH